MINISECTNLLIYKDHIPSCDAHDGDYEGPGYAFVVRGATGRWCETLWLCRDHIDICDEDEIYTSEKARKLIEAIDGDWADF